MATETESKTDSKPEIQFNERTLEAFEKEKSKEKIFIVDGNRLPEEIFVDIVTKVNTL